MIDVLDRMNTAASCKRKLACKQRNLLLKSIAQIQPLKLNNLRGFCLIRCSIANCVCIVEVPLGRYDKLPLGSCILRVLAFHDAPVRFPTAMLARPFRQDPRMIWSKAMQMVPFDQG